MEIVKFKNIGGIRSIDHPELIKGNVVIYSPNGTMKTSFSTGISKIQNGLDPSDVDRPGTAEFEINNGTEAVSSLADGPKLNALVISREEDEKYFTPSVVLAAAQGVPASFAMSDELKARYAKAQIKLDNLSHRAEDVLRFSFKAHSKIDPEKVAADWLGQDQTSIDLVCSLTKTDFDSSLKLPKSAKNVDFIAASKAPVIRLGKDPVFTKNVSSYVACVKKDFSEKGVFNTEFTVDGLQKIYDLAVQESFFDDTHKLQINGKIYGKTETEDLIIRAVKEIYGDSKNKDAFNESKEKLSKKNVSPLKDIIDTKPELLFEIQDYESFLHQLICLSITDFSVIEAIKTEYSALKSEIREIAKQSEEERPVWNETVALFNQRFFSNGFTAKLVNRDMVLLKKAPAIQLVMKRNGQPVSPALQGKLSTGEKDSLWILKIVFDIKKREIGGKPLNIILDDVADSFDYKNKYALIMYLRDLLRDSPHQIVVLTHSFDFFRTVLALGRDRISGLLAYKKEMQSLDSEVSLLSCTEGVYSTLVAVNGWKKSSDLKFGFAYLPVLRSLEQISKGTSSCPSVQTLDGLMHYDLATSHKTIEDMKNAFGATRFGCLYDSASGADALPCPFFSASNLPLLYFASLQKEAKRIRPNMPETDLPSKLVLALFIRMSCERMMVERVIGASLALPSNLTVYSRTLQKLAIEHRLVSEEEKEIIEESLLIGDSFAHMNSFLDAPLIDVGPEQLDFLFDFFDHLYPLSGDA